MQWPRPRPAVWPHVSPEIALVGLMPLVGLVAVAPSLTTPNEHVHHVVADGELAEQEQQGHRPATG